MSDDTPPDAEIDERRRSLLITSATAGLLGLGSAVTGAERSDEEATESSDEPSTATKEDFVDAIATDDVMTSIASIEYEGVDSQLTTFDDSIQGFPTGGTQFSGMSSGVAEQLAGSPETFVSTAVDGVTKPDFSPDGFDAFDVATLTIEITVPEGADNLAFDYKFGTEENPSFLGSEFQDFFEAIVFEPDGSAKPVGLLPDGSPVTVSNANAFSNSPGGSSQNPSPPLPEPQDTTLNAVTELQTASYNLSGMAGETILLVLRVADASDGIFDAGVFVDNLRFAGEVESPGYLNVESALEDYREAAVGAIEAEARAQARLEAAFVERYGQEYTTNATDFWGYLAGIVDGGNLDDGFVASSEALIQDLDQDVFSEGLSVENQAEMLYQFKSELYDAMSGASNPEQVAFEYYKGTHSDQSNTFVVDDGTIGDQVTAFQTEFDEISTDIVSTLESESPGASQVDRFVANIDSATRELQTFANDVVEDADRMVEKFDEEGDDIELDIIGTEMERSDPGLGDIGPYTTGQPVDPQIALGGAGLVGIGVGGAALGIKGYAGFKAATLVGGSVLAGGAVMTAWAAASKTIYSMTTKLVKYLGKKLIKEWAKEQIERAFERNFVNPDAIDAQIDSFELSDVDGSNLEEEDILATWWNTVMDLFDPPFGSDWSTATYGRQTGEVTITNTGVEDLYPVFTVTLSGWTPDPQQENYERIGLPIEWSAPVPGPTTVAPGETETFEFDYRVPVEAYDQAQVSVSVSDVYLVSELDSTNGQFSIEKPEGILPVDVFSGSIPEDETVSSSYTPSSDTELLTCALTYNDHYLDLHFYDSSGNHTGFDYDTNAPQEQIPGSSYSGRDTGEENLEWIALNDVNAEELTVEVVAPTITTLGADGKAQSPTVSNVDATAIEIEGDAVSNEVPVLPGKLAFLMSNVMRGVQSGNMLTTTLTVEETNDFTGVDSATLSISDLNHYNDVIPAGNVSLDPSSISVSAGGSTAVDLTVDVPDDVQPGKYEGTITVDGGDTSAELTLRVMVDPQELPPALEGTDIPRDPDGDGLYEDVDADGSFNIFDVQAFFNNFDRPVVQNDVDNFDFDGDGDITIFDVQALFNQLSE